MSDIQQIKESLDFAERCLVRWNRFLEEQSAKGSHYSAQECGEQIRYWTGRVKFWNVALSVEEAAK